MMYGYPWQTDGTGWWWMMGVGSLVGLVVLAVIVWLVVWTVRQYRPAGVDNPARRILDERFARGEIDASEYSSRLSLLSSSGARTKPRS